MRSGAGMTGLVKPPIVSVLIAQDLAVTIKALQAVLAECDGFVLPQSGRRGGDVFEIAYCGISLTLAVRSDLPDIAPYKKIFCNLDGSDIGCYISIELGDHVDGGERVPAVVQAILGVAAQLGTSLDAVGVMWHPAHVVSGFPYFCEAVNDYLAGGAFPVLALINFKAEMDGNINTNGLAWLSGQELSIAPGILNQNDMMRRAVRVVHDIATNGPVKQHVKLSGIEPDEVIELEPLLDMPIVRMNSYSGSAR